ncbi:hypothetical protein NAMH_0883 [Nautilia profundicola AmH]|uniref:Uncharacterized protein n=1 Tax=Nautilia profundicola (strain ATCC BAA-1463 / DSM 18972 / AmH) TaxID=598659 RepID=B9L9H8_NAUPA|nr:hypothetical protein [Nautilia profundicola]ACM92064.1 hypothetical protein NAMH_0883 [Nautilia profundicola AmH]
MKEKILSFFSFLSDTVWDLSPNSPLAFIIYLILITVICLFFIFYFARKSKNNNTNKSQKHHKLTLDDLIDIADNPKSNTADLLSALMLFNEKFVVAQDKEKSMLFFEKILNHKHRHKKLFDYFHGSILPKNITYKDELDTLEKKALNK